MPKFIIGFLISIGITGLALILFGRKEDPIWDSIRDAERREMTSGWKDAPYWRLRDKDDKSGNGSN